MKAWTANDVDCEYTTIVFANTAGEAKARAIETETLMEEPFVDIRVRRFKQADCLYKGFNEIDWCDPDTRIKLVRDFDWECTKTSAECDSCVAKAWCDTYLRGVE